MTAIPVKNVSRGPQPVDGCGVLTHGQTGKAKDTEHTAALIDAGLIIEMPGKPAAATSDKE
jgi:hypothetical protein